MRTLRWTALVAALCAGACDAPEEGADGGRDAATSRDADTPDAGGSDAGPHDGGRVDGGASDAGASSDAGDGGGAPADAGVDSGASDGGTSADASAPDAGSFDLGEVACRTHAECASGQVCDLDAPGGRCQSCTGTGSCSAGYECLFGTCLLECSTDADCNVGMRCANFAESRYCAPRSCASCPAPYECRAGSCARPLCASGACPAPLVCSGTHCVEP